MSAALALAGNATFTTVTAGDDIDIAATAGAVTLTSATTSGTGPDTASVTFSAPQVGTPGGIGFAAETLPKSTIRITAGSMDVGTATAATGALMLTANTGQLSLGTGSAGTTATLRKNGTTGSLAVSDTLTGGTGVLMASATNIAAGGATVTATTGDLLATATSDLSLGTGRALAGTVALQAGGAVALSGTLQASEDVAVQAGTTASFATVTAGDDIDIAATGAVTLTSATTSGTGPDTASVTFSTPQIGTPGAIGFAAETLPGSVIRITASSLAGPAPLDGGGEAALEAGVLSGGAFTVTADTGDIHLKQLTATSGNIDVTATQGSIAGVGSTTWSAATPAQGVQLISAGAVTLAVSGAAEIGSIQAAGAVATIGSTPSTLHIGRVTAGSVDLSAVNRLAVDAGTVAGTVALHTSGGTPGAFALDDPTLVAGHGAANLSASAAGAAINAGAPLGAAQLGIVTADAGISVSAQAVQVASATAATGALSLTASAGRLSLGTGSAGTTATLRKNGTIGSLLLGGVSPNSLTGGTGVLLSSRTAIDASGATVTATTGDLLATATTDLSLGAGHAQAGTTALQAGGMITVTGTLSASEDVAAQAGTTASFATVIAGDDIDIAAGAVTLASATTSGTGPDTASVTFTAGTPGTIGFAAETLPKSTIRITAGSMDVGTATAATGALMLTANTGQLTLGTGSAGTTATLRKNGTIGSLALGGVSPNTLTGGTGVLLSSQTAIDAGGATVTATTGNLLATATSDLSLGTGKALAGTVALQAGGAVASSGTLSASEDVAAQAGTTASFTNVTAGDDIDIAATGAVTLASAMTSGTGPDTASVTFTAGTPGTIGFAAETLPDSTIRITAGSMDVGTATAATGALMLTANTGQLSLGTGSAGKKATLQKKGTAGSLAISGTLTAGTGVLMASAANIAAGGATVTATTGDLLATATSDLSLGTGKALAGTVALQAGGAVASSGTLSASEDVAIRAGTSATMATLNAGDDIDLTANTITLASATSTGTGPDNRSVQFTAALAGQAGGISFGPETAELTGNSARIVGNSVSISGAVAVLGGNSTIILRDNGGAPGTTSSIGDGLSGSGFDFTQGMINGLNAANVVIDAGTRNVTFGALALDADTGTKSLRFLTTGSISITNKISGAGTGVLQLGGSSAADPSASGPVDSATLAKQITADIGDSGEHVSIDLPKGTLDLRAQRIVFGKTSLIDKYLPAGGSPLADNLVALDVANAASPLYISDGTGRQFIGAKLLRVSYSNFALFQDTGGPAGAGVSLNVIAPPAVVNLALQLFSSGDGGGNSFALFGTINGFIGRSAGILPNESIEIATPLSVPRVTRITQSSSRVNGCVIGSPDKGCLVTDPPRPNLSIYDARQTQLFQAADDPSGYVNPLVGRSNEGLIVDIANPAVSIDTIDCGPDGRSCATGGEKPQ